MSTAASPVRRESDALGVIEIPKDALFGVNTARGQGNFAISHRRIGEEPAFVRALVQVKAAAALANRDLGAVSPDRADAIVASCNEIIAGQHLEWFVIDMLEGSGGTSINMNTNEVIANRALQILGHAPGDYGHLHPNDHVNCCQSTNDVIPTALKLACHALASDALRALEGLADALADRAEAFDGVLRLGRTCLQDAQPMTLGQAFGGYASGVRRCREKLAVATGDLLVVPLGGTAIGTGLGAVPGYRATVLRHLSSVVGARVTGSGDLFDGMQNSDAFARISAELRASASLMGKIAADLILLSSGPAGGLGEIRLPSVQAGSSIMPGKVNPVIPMMVQQVAFVATGNDLAVSLAALNGQLEINPFEPVVASRLFETFQLVTQGATIFGERCVAGIEADEERSLANLMASSALATVLVPKLGYARTSNIVGDSLASGRSFTDLVVEQGHLSALEIARQLRRSTAIEEGTD